MMKTIFYDIRQDLDITLQEMATLCGVSLSTIHTLETGNANQINTNVRQMLAKLGYDMERIKRDYNRDRQAKAEKLFREVAAG